MVIEPGMLLQGPCGQIREMVSIDGPEATFRQVDNGTWGDDARLPRVGEVRTVRKKYLAHWAVCEVTGRPAC